MTKIETNIKPIKSDPFNWIDKKIRAESIGEIDYKSLIDEIDSKENSISIWQIIKFIVTEAPAIVKIILILIKIIKFFKR